MKTRIRQGQGIHTSLTDSQIPNMSTIVETPGAPKKAPAPHALFKMDDHYRSSRVVRRLDFDMVPSTPIKRPSQRKVVHTEIADIIRVLDNEWDEWDVCGRQNTPNPFNELDW